jgi:hypothetical protein
MVLAGCARSSIDHDASNGKDSVHIVDATHPSSPRIVADWTLGANPFRGVGWLPKKFAHSVRFEDDGQSLYVSNWDAGTIHLDISDPSPVIVSKTVIVPRDEDGDNHSMTLANGGRWLVINTEDFSPAASPGKNKLGGARSMSTTTGTRPIRRSSGPSPPRTADPRGWTASTPTTTRRS